MQAKKTELVTVRTLVGTEGFTRNLQDVIESVARQKGHEILIIGGAKDTDFYEAIARTYLDSFELLWNAAKE